MENQEKPGQGGGNGVAFNGAASGAGETPLEAEVVGLGYDPQRIHCDGYLGEFEEISAPMVRQVRQAAIHFQCGGLSNDK